MRVTEHRIVLRVGAGVAAFAAWLLLGATGIPLAGRANIDDGADLLGLVSWFAAGVLSGAAPRRRPCRTSSPRRHM